MKLILDDRVLVICFAERPAPEVIRMATQNAWPLVSSRRTAEALREIRRHHPAVAVVYITLRVPDELELIALLPTLSVEVAVVGIARSHGDEIERAVRSAGAVCYLPVTADDNLIRRTVGQLLARHQRGRESQLLRPRAARRRVIETRTLSSFFPPPPTQYVRATGLTRPSPDSARRRGRG